ncbi:hypothetical protein V1478_013219 [Vespula squamosa]|uniref:Uncharacterized protein n=1 Tax=Vespula squamosa TaxID=30214 RepID=A0ABD2AA80_VESSQ
MEGYGGLERQLDFSTALENRKRVRSLGAVAGNKERPVLLDFSSRKPPNEEKEEEEEEEEEVADGGSCGGSYGGGGDGGGADGGGGDGDGGGGCSSSLYSTRVDSTPVRFWVGRRVCSASVHPVPLVSDASIVGSQARTNFATRPKEALTNILIYDSPSLEFDYL